MTKIPKCIEGEKVVECLMVTTESSHLFVLDPETFTIVEQRKVKYLHTFFESTFFSVETLFSFLRKK